MAWKKSNLLSLFNSPPPFLPLVKKSSLHLSLGKKLKPSLPYLFLFPPFPSLFPPFYLFFSLPFSLSFFPVDLFPKIKPSLPLPFSLFSLLPFSLLPFPFTLPFYPSLFPFPSPSLLSHLILFPNQLYTSPNYLIFNYIHPCFLLNQ